VVGCSGNDDKCGIFLVQMKNYGPLNGEYILKSWVSLKAMQETYRCTIVANLATERKEIS